MSRHIVVDGYNLLFAIGRGAKESDRNYLLDILADYKTQKNVDITVVFDRKTGLATETAQRLLRQSVHVIFTAPRQEADEIIRGIVDSSKRPGDILVVSSDKAGVSKYCRKIGAEIVESKDFFEFLTKRKRSGAEEDAEVKPLPCQEDINYYLKKFND